MMKAAPLTSWAKASGFGRSYTDKTSCLNVKQSLTSLTPIELQYKLKFDWEANAETWKLPGVFKRSIPKLPPNMI